MSYSGHPLDSVCITVSAASSRGLPAEELVVEVCGDSVYVACPGCEPLQIQLPVGVASEGADAVLDSALQTLALKFPVRSCGSILEQVS